MKTEDLIQALSADLHRSPGPERRLPLALVITTLVFGGAYLAVAGIRPDFATAAGQAMMMLKQIFPVVLAVGGLGLALRLSRPGEGPGAWPWLLLAVPVVLTAAVVAELVRLPAELWMTTLIGHSLPVCLTMIPLIAAPITVAAFWALRSGAPTRPGLCGAVLGLMSGGAAAAAYAFFCDEDAPLFFAVWYCVGILLVTGLGALAGRRYLRW